jgi:hypothetical protein
MKSTSLAREKVDFSSSQNLPPEGYRIPCEKTTLLAFPHCPQDRVELARELIHAITLEAVGQAAIQDTHRV